MAPLNMSPKLYLNLNPIPISFFDENVTLGKFLSFLSNLQQQWVWGERRPGRGEVGGNGSARRAPGEGGRDDGGEGRRQCKRRWSGR